MVTQVGYSVAGRSGGQVASYAVCTVNVETRSTSFLIEPQNQGRQFSPVWPQNRWRRIFWFGSQNWQLRFGDLCVKIIAVISWFGRQNQTDFGLSVAPQNRWKEDGMGHTSRSGGLLRLEASRVRVSQSNLKTDGGAITDDARGTITEVTSRSS
jgi:hypothetical protein